MDAEPEEPIDALDIVGKETFLAPAGNRTHFSIKEPLPTHHGSTPYSITFSQAGKGKHFHNAGSVPLFLWCSRYL
jgi:hypothetical protein